MRARHFGRSALPPLPVEQFEALKTVEDLVALIEAEVGDREAIDPHLSRLMLEAMREAERDPTLRHRMGGMLAHASADHGRGRSRRSGERRGVHGGFAGGDRDTSGAVGDGLLLKVLLEPELDVRGAVEAIRALLRT